MRLLVSVRSVDEARHAAAGGADFIDLKEPNAGALGGLPLATVREIVRMLRADATPRPISATIGDLPMSEPGRIADAVQATAACGVDYVKVGIEREPAARAVLDRLAACDAAVVPVFIADRGIEIVDVEHAAHLGFPGVMVDTADKRAGSLFDVADDAALRRFVETVRRTGALVGLAGALRRSHLARLLSLSPDFAGFRSAVCAGERGGALVPGLLRSLVDDLAACAATR